VTQKFFRALYGPTLAKLSSKERKVQALLRSTAQRKRSGVKFGFATMDKALLAKMCSTASRNRWASMTPAQKAFQDALRVAGVRRISKKVRKRIATLGGKATQAQITPEQRAASTARLVAARRAQAMRQRMLKLPRWPFAERVE
jgi:uncharacterized protein YnzC (UPF0291/DUF896 family)